MVPDGVPAPESSGKETGGLVGQGRWRQSQGGLGKRGHCWEKEGSWEAGRGQCRRGRTWRAGAKGIYWDTSTLKGRQGGVWVEEARFGSLGDK